MEVWSGSIAGNADPALRGVRLLDPSSSGRCDIIPRDAKLSVRSLVNPALVPLYARAGSSFELHTADNETSQWLKRRLLSNIWLEEEAIEKGQLIQCPVGVLIQVEGNRRGGSFGQPVSDLLIYGILSSAASLERPPTPPVSSSPGIQEQNGPDPVVRRELRIYAAPLSAALIAKAQALPSPPSSPANRTTYSDGQFAEFLPDLRSPSPKRKRVATLFEVAAQHHKRVRQKGGEAVSQLMASANSQPVPQLHPFRIKKEPEEPSNHALERIASHRSRSLSLGGSLRPSRPVDFRLENHRPSTARSQARSTASRRSTPNPFLDSSNRPVEKSHTPLAPQGNSDPLSGLKDASSIVSENKTLITRTILTCMRLYGFHRATSRSSMSKNNATGTHADLELLNVEERDTRTPAPESVPLTTPAGGSDEDEFRAMYHATYRASTFALRRYLKDAPATGEMAGGLPPVLEKEKATNLIDNFLRLFCEDA